MNRVWARRVGKGICITGFGSVVFLVAFLLLWTPATMFHYEAGLRLLESNIFVLVAACMLISARLLWEV